jgi:hypothetical protein
MQNGALHLAHDTRRKCIVIVPINQCRTGSDISTRK